MRSAPRRKISDILQGPTPLYDEFYDKLKPKLQDIEQQITALQSDHTIKDVMTELSNILYSFQQVVEKEIDQVEDKATIDAISAHFVELTRELPDS